jgi:hypothetical protein
MKLLCTCLLLLSAASLFAQETPPETRSYYVEFGVSVTGEYEAARMENASYPLALSRGLSIATNSYFWGEYEGSPSIEFGVSMKDKRVWLFTGMEAHALVDQFDGNSLRYGIKDSVATITEKSNGGYSFYAGFLLEHEVFSFLGYYGRLAIGSFRFDQVVVVEEIAGQRRSVTAHRSDAGSFGGTAAVGLYINFWGVKLRGGYRMMQTVGGKGSAVSSNDIRMSLSLPF